MKKAFLNFYKRDAMRSMARTAYGKRPPEWEREGWVTCEMNGTMNSIPAYRIKLTELGNSILELEEL